MHTLASLKVRTNTILKAPMKLEEEEKENRVIVLCLRIDQLPETTII